MFTLKEAIELIELDNKSYYVYCLHRPDESILYVGKGTRKVSRCDQRIASHEYEAKAEDRIKLNPYANRLKLNSIKKIWRNNEEVKYTIDSFHDTEESAYNREKELIALLGRKIKGDGLLTNISEGGESEILPEESREKISESLKEYYALNPDKLEEMRERNRQYAIDHPELADVHRKRAIDNDYASNIKKWLNTVDEGVLKKKFADHGEFMKEWHASEEGKEKTKIVAAKRNEKFRTDEHRNHMSEKTKNYAKNNPEAWKAARLKVKLINDEKMIFKQECYSLIEKHLAGIGKIIVGSRKLNSGTFYKWKKNGFLSEDILKIMLEGDDKLENWRNRKFQLESNLFAK